MTRFDEFLLLKYIRTAYNLDNLQVKFEKHMSVIPLFSDTKMM